MSLSITELWATIASCDGWHDAASVTARQMLISKLIAQHFPVPVIPPLHQTHRTRQYLRQLSYADLNEVKTAFEGWTDPEDLRVFTLCQSEIARRDNPFQRHLTTYWRIKIKSLSA